MDRKRVFFACVIVVISFSSVFVFAQDSVEALKAKLQDVRERKAQLNIDYENGAHLLTEDWEVKIAKIKTDFRLARENLVSDHDGKMKRLREDYEGKMKSVLKEENALVEGIGPAAREDFVKTKTERRSG